TGEPPKQAEDRKKPNPSACTGLAEHLLPRRHGLIQSFPRWILRRVTDSTCSGAIQESHPGQLRTTRNAAPRIQVHRCRSARSASEDADFTVPLVDVHYCDLNGNVHAIPAQGSIVVGPKPILLEHLP